MQIRRATEEDAGRISEINVFSWRSTYRGIIDDDFLFRKLSVLKNTEGYRKYLNKEEYETYVYEEENIIKGFSTIGSSRDEDRANAFELWAIYVDPLMKENGIGSKLINHFEKNAIERGYEEVLLWVFEENIQARGFYEKMGYKKEGKEKRMDLNNALEIRYLKKLKKKDC